MDISFYNLINSFFTFQYYAQLLRKSKKFSVYNVVSEIKESIEKYKKILGITNERISIGRDPVTFAAELDWDNSSKTWIIKCESEISEYYLIHELGHIYLARKVSHYDGFALPSPYNERIDQSLYPLINNLLDNFVDYNLSLFNEIYPILISKYFEYLDQFEEFKEMVDNCENFFTLLSWYFIFYIEFHYIVREVDKKKYKKTLNNLLSYLCKHLLEFKDIMDKKKLENVQIMLNKFEEKRFNKEHKQIILFIINVLYSIDLWDKNNLIKQIKLFFPHL